MKNNRLARNERLTVSVAKCYVKTNSRWTTVLCSSIAIEIKKKNSESKALFDSENVENGTEFSRVNDWVLCKSKHNFDGMQRTLFDPAKNNSLVAAKFVLKMRQGRKVFWNLPKTSERLSNFRRLAHILLKRSRSRTFIKKYTGLRLEKG